MSELAAVLAGASPRSLVVLDELGRGTANHDGYALAYAVLAHLGQCTGCRVLFTSHYHGLTHEPLMLPYVSLAHMAHTTTPEGAFAPLHTLKTGPAPEASSGIQVAGMAGLPPRLLSHAHKVAALLSQQLQQRLRPAQNLDNLLGNQHQDETYEEDQFLSCKELTRLRHVLYNARQLLQAHSCK